jgi:GNAT superfamily N-acetyltransferase
VAVAETLPEWFNDHARHVAIPTDLSHQSGFLAESEGRVIGFLTLFVSDGRLNINWIAVRKDHHRRGVGAKLVARAERAGAEMNIDELATWTLGDGVDYEPYEWTRAFYRKCGFTVYQRSRTDNPDCPEEIRIKKKVARL